ncbi:MAG: hypothetical protein NWE89_13750 [Candidatus Bathyarchaeota archaeon]|nr:hypothetical protein [Candidatus Bathyarchaeota archaeon]
MESKIVSAQWLQKISWEELMTLTVCLTIDLLEYAVPILMSPIYGDILDIVGFVFAAIYFNLIGAITLLELIPGLDIVPFFTLTWLTWYIYRRRKLRKRMDEELEKWL